MSVTDGHKSNVLVKYGIFSSMLKNHESHLRKQHATMSMTGGF